MSFERRPIESYFDNQTDIGRGSPATKKDLISLRSAIQDKWRYKDIADYLEISVGSLMHWYRIAEAWFSPELSLSERRSSSQYVSELARTHHPSRLVRERELERRQENFLQAFDSLPPGDLFYIVNKLHDVLRVQANLRESSNDELHVDNDDDDEKEDQNEILDESRDVVDRNKLLQAQAAEFQRQIDEEFKKISSIPRGNRRL